MDQKTIYQFARSGIVAKIHEWNEKRKAVEQLTDVLSNSELERMLKGIDTEISELRNAMEEIENFLKTDA